MRSLLLCSAMLAGAACASIDIRAVGGTAGGGTGSGKKFIRTVAIAPLVNRSECSGAAEAFGALLAEKLSTRAGLQVVELPPDLRIVADYLDRTRAQEIAIKLEVDGLVTGTIFAYDYSTEGRVTTPSIRVDVRLVAAATGNILWAAAAEGTQPLLFKNDSIPMTELADELTERLAVDLAQRL